MGRNNDNDTAEVPACEAPYGIEKFSVSEGKEEGARKLEISFDFGGSPARAVELFGEEAVYNGFVKGAKVALQGQVRAKLALDGDDAITDEDILSGISEWKPGARTTRAASKSSKLEKLVGGMSDEEKLALIEKLQNM